MKKILTGLLFCLLLPMPASAEVEDWYTYWAIGLANHNYPGEFDAVMDSLDALPGVERTELGLDMFGFYWPYTNNTMLGFVISGSSDHLEDGFGDYIQFNQYLYGLSAMHFFGKEIGDGFYLRGDAGIARASIDSNFAGGVSSDNGTGFLFGFGHAWPLSARSRILVGVNVSGKTIEGDSYSSTSLVIGGLW